MKSNFQNTNKTKIAILLFCIVFVLIVLTSCEARPPWKNARVYTDAGQTININTGDKFIIGFSMAYNLFPIMEELFDDRLVTLVDKEINATEEQNQNPAYSWFLFETLTPGETQITINQLYHITGDLQVQKTFTVIIK